MTEERTPDVYISKSSVAAHVRCSFLHHATYRLGARPVHDTKLDADRGNVLHAGILEGIVSGAGTFEAAMEAATNCPQWATIQAEGIDQEALCMAVLHGSCQAFAVLRDQADVIACEEKLTRDEHVGDRLVRYTVKNDGVLKEHRPYVLELKTTRSYVDQRYWERADVDLQNWFYQDELRNQHGHDIESLCWQVVKLPTQKKFKYSELGLSVTEYIAKIGDMMANKTDTWFPYMHFEYDEQKALAARRDVQYHRDRMLWDLDRAEAGLPIGRSTGACFDFQRRCEYYAVCHDGETLENKELYQLRRDR